MKVLLTGGCGFIGSAVVRHLMRRTGHTIVNVDKMTYAASETALEEARNDPRHVLIKADIAKLETFYADTLVYTHSSGSVDDKAKYLANLKAGGTKYLSIDRDDVKVNLYGNTAIVTCHALIKLKANGTDRTVDARMIHVYSKIKGRWQMVAHQTTKLG